MEQKLLSEVYQCPIAVSKHPILHCPLILPLGRNGTAERQAPSIRSVGDSSP